MTTATSMPSSASAFGNEPATSANPPVLAKGTTSEAATTMRRLSAIALPKIFASLKFYGGRRAADGGRQKGKKRSVNYFLILPVRRPPPAVRRFFNRQTTMVGNHPAAVKRAGLK